MTSAGGNRVLAIFAMRTTTCLLVGLSLALYTSLRHSVENSGTPLPRYVISWGHVAMAAAVASGIASHFARRKYVPNLQPIEGLASAAILLTLGSWFLLDSTEVPMRLVQITAARDCEHGVNDGYMHSACDTKAKLAQHFHGRK